MALRDDLQAWITSSFDSIKAKMSPPPEAAELIKQLDQAKAQLKASEEKIQTQATALNEKTTEILELKKAKDDLAANVAAKDKEISELKAKAQTVTQKAAELVSAQGVEVDKLPATPSAEAETLESVRARLAQEKDPAKAQALAQKCRELRGHGDLFKSKTQ